MKHIITAVLVATLASTSAFAGGLAPAIDQAPVVIEEGPVGSSGAQFVVGLIILGLIIAASSGKSGEVIDDDDA